MRKTIYKILLLIVSISLANSLKGQNSVESKKNWSLQKCIDYMLTNNISLKRNKLEIERANLNYYQSRASRLPNVNANASTGVQLGRSINPTENSFVTEPIFFTSASLNSSIVLFGGLQQLNTVKQNMFLLESNKYSYEKAQNDAIIATISYYFNVIFNQELFNNAKMQRDAIKEQLNSTEQLVQAGKLTNSTLLELKAQLANMELEIVNAENNVSLAILSLKQIMQLSDSVAIEVAYLPVSLEKYPPQLSTVDEIYEKALVEQPDIKSAKMEALSTQIGLKLTKGAYLPRLILSANLSSNYSSFSDGERFIPDGTFSNDFIPIGFVANSNEIVNSFNNIPNGTIDNNYSFFEQFSDNLAFSSYLSLSVPVFNGLQTRSNYQRALISHESAQLYLEERKNNLRQTIETAYYDARAAYKAYDAASKQVIAYEEIFRIVSKKLELGAANFTDYQIASSNLFIAQSDLLKAKYDYVFKRVILDFYQGKPLKLLSNASD